VKAWKAVALAAFAFIAVALMATTALAYNAAGQTTNGPNGGYGATQESAGGMLHGSMGGQMGYGYSQYINSTSSGGYPQQYGSCTGGCGMRNG